MIQRQLDEAGFVTISVMHLYKTAQKLKLSRTTYSSMKNGMAFGHPGNAREHRHVLLQMLKITEIEPEEIIELQYDE